MATLVLITESYPFGGLGEPGFIAPEIKFLASEFDRIIITPVLDFGANETLPDNVMVDKSFLALPRFSDKLKSLLKPYTYKALIKDLNRIRHFSDLRSELAFSAYTLYYRNRIRDLIAKHSLNLDETLFYTFWFDYATAALSLIDGAKFITRAHCQDLYEDVAPFKSRYWRNKSLSLCLNCYAVSDYSAYYLQETYPSFSHKIQCRYLGTIPPKRLNPSEKTDGTISLISCARIAPEKRIIYEYKIIKEYAKRNSTVKVKWSHIGDGPEMELLRADLHDSPSNLNVVLWGSISNEDVHRILENKHYDLFLLLSHTEGLPIAICEALSVGIPILGTDIPPISETIGNAGFTCPVNDDLSLGADNLGYALENATEKRETARQQWKNNFNASILRENFAKEIRQILG